MQRGWWGRGGVRTVELKNVDEEGLDVWEGYAMQSAFAGC
jgi:hypothetical protein